MREGLPDNASGWHRRVFHLTWPVLLANLTIPLVGVVDTAVMGQLDGPQYIGAVAIGSQIFSAMYWIFGFLRMATTGLMAQAYGAEDEADAKRIAWRSAILGVGIGTLLVALQWPLQAGMLWLFEAGEQVESLSARYFSIRIWGAPALLVQTVMLGILFGLQRMRATLTISLMYNGANILLDLLFVPVFGWGVEGVALATVLSEVLAAGVAIQATHRAFAEMGWTVRRPERLWREGVLKLFSVSGNLVIRSFFVQLPFFMVTLLGASLGDVTLAANAILMQLFMIMAFAIDGFAHSAESLAGFAYGARDRRSFRKAAAYCTEWAVGLAALLTLAYAVGGPWFIERMSSSEAVRLAAENHLWWLVIGPLIGVWPFLGDGIFIGTTHVKELRNCMFVAATVFLVCAYGSISVFGNHGLWASFTLFMVIRGIGLALYYPRIEARISA